MPKNNIYLIEDCAQSYGSKINKQYSGSFGDIAALSMNPMKVLSAFGDAGVVTTSSKKIFKNLQILRYAGVDMSKDNCLLPNLNHKIDTLQAVILNHKIKGFNKVIKKRILIANYYQNHLTNKVIKPIFKDNFEHIYYTYQIRTKKRSNLINYLSNLGIETKIQQNKLIYDHPGLRQFNIFNDDFKNGNKLKKEILCLPIHESLELKEIEYVCKCVNNFFN